MKPAWTDSELHPIPVGISSCLLGEKVRYDGQHKRSSYCQDVLARYFAFKPFCPEMAIGLGTPRPIIRLVGEPGTLRAIQHTDPQRDITSELADYADVVQAAEPALCGYIFTEKSPSCGLFRVKAYNGNGTQINDSSRGIFARRLTDIWPQLPVEESGRLNDADLCENFVLRVYTWHEWHTTVLPTITAQSLIAFWSRYKFLVLAHDESTYRKIGPLLSNLVVPDLRTHAKQFFSLVMQALEKKSTRASNTNALQHLGGFVKKHLHESEKESLNTLVTQYRHGIVPLIVPLSMLRHLLSRYPDDYANEQRFLNPYPDELGLRNNK
ncbi:MAG TPA: DUF523 and DUF1722 domain-containing protein [Pseudomonadales bacterium]|nr:DUF523 and DUF1722 domain-containing protein [Pseudomonadales bacterium]